MSKLADILKNEYKSKGIVTGAASAIGKKSLEKLDIRNALFGGSGIGSVLGRKIFGKGYSATSSKTAPTSSIQSSQTSGVDNALLQAINQNATITAKNTMGIPMMARDMNVMRQNVVKLVKLQGGTPSTKADMFFSKAKEREAMYESAMEKNKPTKLGQKANDDPDKKGFIGKLLEYGTFLFAGLKAILSKIPDMLSSVVGGALKTIMNIFSIDNIMKVMGIASNTLSTIIKFAGVVAANPVFLTLAALGTAAAMLAELRGDVDEKRAKFLELAKEKKDAGELSPEKEKELQSIKTPANQKAAREQLGGYDPITNKIENPNASLENISNLEKQARVAPAMPPGTAKMLLDAGEYDGYTKQQLESWSQGKNAASQKLVTSEPPTYNPVVDQTTNMPAAPTNAPAAPTNAPSRMSSGNVTMQTPPPAATAPTGISQQIGGAESLGNYNVSFGDRKLKSGKFTNIAETQTGKSLTDMTLKEVGEYQATRGANGAVGKYQFMTTTLFGRKDSKGKLIPGLVQQEGLDVNTTKFTPEIQERLQKRLLEQNSASLKNMNIPITPGNQYMAHYIGPAGTKAVHEAIQKNPNMSVADAMTAKGYKIGNNPELHKLKVGEFESTLAGRLKKNENPHATKLANAPSNKGQSLATSSSEVNAARDSAITRKPETVVVTTPAPAPQVSGMGGTVTMASVTDDELARQLFYRQVA
jgi:hypothetical protein